MATRDSNLSGLPPELWRLIRSFYPTHDPWCMVCRPWTTLFHFRSIRCRHEFPSRAILTTRMQRAKPKSFSLEFHCRCLPEFQENCSFSVQEFLAMIPQTEIFDPNLNEPTIPITRDNQCQNLACAIVRRRSTDLMSNLGCLTSLRNLTLTITCVGLGDDLLHGFRHICSRLTNLTALYLDFRTAGFFSENGFAALAEALTGISGTLATLHLNLSRTTLNTQSCSRYLGPMLSRLTNLQALQLDVEHTFVDEDGAQALSSALQGPRDETEMPESNRRRLVDNCAIFANTSASGPPNPSGSPSSPSAG